MQDTKTSKKKDNRPKIDNSLPNQDFFLAPIPLHSISPEQNKHTKNFLGKKLTGDAELISWLSGVEINNKNIKEEEGIEENNSKIKKKLKNKLIKNAKKCENYYIHSYPEEKYISIQCAYCLKKIFNHNELIRFVNFDDFAYYLKYLFYISDKVLNYSINNFKSNKISFDILFSKFKKKEEKWIFNQEKIICKLCMLKLINKPNFMQKIKSIFIHGENEKSYNLNDGDIVIELNLDESKNNSKSNFIVEKIKNDSNKNKYKNYENKNKKQTNNNNYNKRSLFPSNNYNNPNRLNIYNSNNININIKNNNKIINNAYINNNNSFLDLCEKVKNNNNGINDINPGQINFYWRQLYIITHNKIVDFCIQIYNEIFNLRYYMIYKNNQDNKEKKESLNNENILEKSKNRTEYLFKQIIYSIIINDNYLNVFFRDLNNYKVLNNYKRILNDLINENKNNYNYINQIIERYLSIINIYKIILKRK